MSPLAALKNDPNAQIVEFQNVRSKQLFLENDSLLKRLEEAVRPYHIEILNVPDGVQITGDDIGIMLGVRILEQLAELQGKTGMPNLELLETAISSVIEYALNRDLAFRLKGLFRPVRPLSLNQVAFMNALLSDEEEMVLGIGSTGTGKTHLALAAGLSLLAQDRVKHIIVTRPHIIVEGEIVTREVRQETVCDEQFAVIDDILHDLIGAEEFERLIDQRKLQIVPLGRMRGRTFNNSFIIVDESENMTVQRMRMVTSRLGRSSRIVVIGDPSQVDLPSGVTSGLTHFLNMIEGANIAQVHSFEVDQIVRNDLVARIERLYCNDRECEVAT